MAIAADCLLRPDFSPEEFEKERQNRIDSLKAAKDNPGQAVRLYFRKAYFGSHPLGHLAGGTDSSLAADDRRPGPGILPKLSRPAADRHGRDRRHRPRQAEAGPRRARSARGNAPRPPRLRRCPPFPRPERQDPACSSTSPTPPRPISSSACPASPWATTSAPPPR